MCCKELCAEQGSVLITRSNKKHFGDCALPETTFQHLNGGYEKEGDRVFSRVCCDRTTGNDFKLKEGRFRLDIKEKLFYSEGGEAHGTGCPESWWMLCPW